MPDLVQVTPIVPVTDLARSVDFFQKILGFVVGFRSEVHTYVFRDAVAFRLVPAGPDKDLSDSNSQQHCYVDVSDIDALHAELAPRLDGLPAGRVRKPFDTDYGQREFHVIDPDILQISFGEKPSQDICRRIRFFVTAAYLAR